MINKRTKTEVLETIKNDPEGVLTDIQELLSIDGICNGDCKHCQFSEICVRDAQKS